MAHTFCPNCTNSNHGDYIYKCEGKIGHIFCLVCRKNSSGIFSTYCPECGSPAHDIGKIENPFEKQKELDEEKSRDELRKARDYQSRQNKEIETPPVVGAIVFLIGIGFLIWLYFKSKDQYVEPYKSIFSQTSQSSNVNQTKEETVATSPSCINLDNIEQDIIGVVIGNTMVNNKSELIKFAIIDSSKNNNELTYKANLEFKKNDDKYVSFVAIALINYTLNNGQWVFNNVKTIEFRNEIRNARFEGIIGDKPIQLLLENSSDTSSEGKFIYLKEPELERKISIKSFFSSKSIYLEVLSGNYTSFYGTLNYIENDNKYEGVVKYRDDAIDSVSLKENAN